MHQRKRAREAAAPSLGRLIEAEGKELLRLAAKAYFVCKTDQELDDLKVLVEGIASQEAARVAARRGPAAAGAPAVEAAVGGAGGEDEAAVPGTAAAVEAAAVEAEAEAEEEGGEEADAAAPVPVEAQPRAAKELLAALKLVPARSRSSLGMLYAARVLRVLRGLLRCAGSALFDTNTTLRWRLLEPLHGAPMLGSDLPNICFPTLQISKDACGVAYPGGISRVERTRLAQLLGVTAPDSWEGRLVPEILSQVEERGGVNGAAAALALESVAGFGMVPAAVPVPTPRPVDAPPDEAGSSRRTSPLRRPPADIAVQRSLLARYGGCRPQGSQADRLLEAVMQLLPDTEEANDAVTKLAEFVESQPSDAPPPPVSLLPNNDGSKVSLFYHGSAAGTSRVIPALDGATINIKVKEAALPVLHYYSQEQSDVLSERFPKERRFDLPLPTGLVLLDPSAQPERLVHNGCVVEFRFKTKKTVEPQVDEESSPPLLTPEGTTTQQ